MLLGQLRVCLRNEGGLGNCGRCKKCICTMIALSALDMLPRAGTFPDRLPEHFERLLSVEGSNDRAFVDEILDFLRARNAPSELMMPIVNRVRDSDRRAAARAYLTNSRLHAALPVLRTARRAGGRLASGARTVGAKAVQISLPCSPP